MTVKNVPVEMNMTIAHITKGLEYWLRREVFKDKRIEIDKVTYNEKTHFKITFNYIEEKDVDKSEDS